MGTIWSDYSNIPLVLLFDLKIPKAVILKTAVFLDLTSKKFRKSKSRVILLPFPQVFLTKNFKVTDAVGTNSSVRNIHLEVEVITWYWLIKSKINLVDSENRIRQFSRTYCSLQSQHREVWNEIWLQETSLTLPLAPSLFSVPLTWWLWLVTPNSTLTMLQLPTTSQWSHNNRVLGEKGPCLSCT